MGGSSPSLPSLACDLGVSLRVVVVVPPRDAMKEERKKHTHTQKERPSRRLFRLFLFSFFILFLSHCCLFASAFFPVFFLIHARRHGPAANGKKEQQTTGTCKKPRPKRLSMGKKRGEAQEGEKKNMSAASV